MIKHSLMFVLLIGFFSKDMQSQSLFPLAKGNTWYYTYSCLWCDGSYHHPPSLIIRVIGDTIMPDGKQYWILDPPDFFGGRYIRSDSNYLSYWGLGHGDTAWREQRMFNYQSQKDDRDTIPFGDYVDARTEETASITLFDKPTTVHSYFLGGIVFGMVKIADGLGYSWYEFRGDESYPFDDWTLTGCLLSDTLYGSTVSVEEPRGKPIQVELFQNYPNPFNGWTIIKYRLSKPERVRLTVSTLLGQQVATLVNDVQPAGQYSAHYFARNLSSGIYIYRLTTSTECRSMRFLYIK